MSSWRLSIDDCRVKIGQLGDPDGNLHRVIQLPSLLDDAHGAPDGRMGDPKCSEGPGP